MTDLSRLAWPFSRAGDAIRALGRRGGLRVAAANLADPPPGIAEGAWIEAAAQLMDLEAEWVQTAYGDFEATIAQGRLLLLKTDHGWLALLSGRRALAPDLRLYRVRAADVRKAVCRAMEDPALEKIDCFLAGTAVDPSRRERARQALLRAELAAQSVTGLRLRAPADGPLIESIRQAGVGRRIAALAAAHGAYLLLWLTAWWVIGVAVLQGHLDRGWLLAWGLLLLTLAPLRVAALWQQGLIALRVGAVLKQRLLVGSLRLDPEAVLAEGAGRLLGRVLEADAVESLALTGGFTGIVAIGELLAALAVLVACGSSWLALALLSWLALAGCLGWNYFHRARSWTDVRLAMTGALVERMVGHRTRLAQESPANWHEGEDRELDGYLDSSQGRDRAEALLATLMPQGWMLLGVALLAPVFLSDSAGPGALAAALGGVLLAYRAFRRLAAAFWQMVDAGIAWEQVRPLMSAASAPRLLGSPEFSAAPQALAGAVLDVQDVFYRYPLRESPVLNHCSLRVAPGDRILLNGPSGGGKSTLVSVLAGIRVPQAGVMLAGGLDRPSVGERGWRRRIVAAPQFHQNHVITGPLLFNLLMGRPAPQAPADAERAAREAVDVCREMGLGNLLDRMPGGVMQLVGETGWQLSQGERSRIFMARALLQGADLVVLDESFGALDPETMRMTLDCVLKRARSVLVVAHQ